MRLVLKPFAIVLGALAGVLSRRLFAIIWSWIDPQEDPPSPTAANVTVAKAVGAAALQGAVFAATSAAVDRAGARGVWNLTGVRLGPKSSRAQRKAAKAAANTEIQREQTQP